jgi:mRNA-degrading endonuclease toxin of MazEF toxin-antitoxin module
MTATPAQRDTAHARAPIRLRDRLLAEALRAVEQDGAALREEGPAEGEARCRGGDFEARIVQRALASSIADSLAAALRRVRQTTGGIVFLGIILALTGGAGAVRTAIGAPRTEPINFFWLLATLLGVQTLLLLLWLLLMIALPRSAGVSPLAAAVLAFGRWLVAKVHRDRGAHQLAAIQATGVIYSRGRIGRWTLSAVSHGLWLSVNAGLLTLLLVMLSAREYTFNWETTILSDTAYVRITRAIAALPEAAGFLTPTAEQIVQSEWRADPAELERARMAWSGLLIGSVVLYGLAPRLLLLGISLDARRRACRRFRLDTEAPGYQRLRVRLMPEAETQGVLAAPDERPPAPGERSEPSAGAARPATGPPAVIGLELDRPATSWPPALHHTRWTDLGFVDSRDDRRRVLAELRDLAEAPRMTVVVCALTTTPDRGIAAIAGEIVRACGAGASVVLTAGQKLRERGTVEQMARRVEDWRALGESVGIPRRRIIEVDLDHLTDTSQRKLADLIGIGAGEPPPARRIEEAFDLIATAGREWNEAIQMKDQAELHRRIAEVYRPSTQTWRGLLHLPAELKKSELARHAKHSATRVVEMLPHRLRRSPKWLAAGALTGKAPSEESPEDAADRIAPAEALRSAALFALLLELQGREEAAITRILDRTLGEADVDDAGLTGPDDGAAWLDEVRHRFDLALTAEGGA